MERLSTTVLSHYLTVNTQNKKGISSILLTKGFFFFFKVHTNHKLLYKKSWKKKFIRVTTMLVLLTYYGLLLFIFHFFLPSACIARGVQLSQAAFPKSLRKVTLGSVPGAPCNQPPSQQLILSFPNLIHTTSFLLSLGAHINSIPTPSLQSKQPSLH